MKSLKFVLPCALALFAAAPAAAASQFVCTSLSDQRSLLILHEGDYAWHKARAQLRAEGRCFDLPARTRFSLVNEFLSHSCIRPQGQAHCVWTADVFRNAPRPSLK